MRQLPEVSLPPELGYMLTNVGLHIDDDDDYDDDDDDAMISVQSMY